MTKRTVTAWLQVISPWLFYSAAAVLFVLLGVSAFVSPAGAWPLCVGAIACLLLPNLGRISELSGPGFKLLVQQAKEKVEHMDKLLRMSVRMHLEMVQRMPRWGNYTDAEMEAALEESVTLLREAGVPDSEITEIRSHAWDRWVIFDYGFYALGLGSPVNVTDELRAEWERLRTLERHPTPDEMEDFLERVGAFDGLRKELVESWRHYLVHTQHQPAWARRREVPTIGT